MSLIERAANMLGPVPESNRKPSAASEGTDRLESGPIERAVSNKSQHPNFPAHQERAPEPVAKDGPAPASGHASRVWKIGLDKLRQQNLITPDEERTPISENFRRIKRHILGNVGNPNSGRATNLVMITSALPAEGKTFCAVNLAISIAMEMDRTVLLVDADVAKPSVAAALGIQADAERGLMDILRDPRIDLASVLCKTDIGKLSVLPAGTRHTRATEMLASERMRVLLEEMAERYHDRIIIFDSPPLLAASEASVLASRIGQILVVVEAGKTTETTLKDALGRIESSIVLGVLLNKGAAPGAGAYGYGYGYGYG
jgi:protein-tyrosine kinase